MGTQYYIHISSCMKPLLNITTYNVIKFSIHLQSYLSSKMIFKNQLHLIFHFHSFFCTYEASQLPSQSSNKVLCLGSFKLIFLKLPKGLFSTKVGTLRRLKSLQIRQNISQQIIIVISNRIIECFKKNYIIWPIEKTFIQDIVNKQGIPKMRI